ncbi:MAG TPA: phosphoethanolamine transferase [Gammaproteobacteria bacterium]|nr:phosphoethanolamine transferase [Gammaproteobacteria bacterium]
MARSNQIARIILAWLVIVLADLFIVRDYAWVIDNWDIKRVAVNFGLSSLAMLLLLFVLKPILARSNVIKVVVFIVIALPVLVQMSHFEVYRSLTSSFGFHAFTEDPWMTLSLWVEQFNILKSIIILSIVFWLIKLLSFSSKPMVKWRYALNTIGFILLYLLTTFSWYGVSNFQNSALAYYSTLLQMSKDQALEFNRDKFQVPKSDASIGGLPNIIYIVGESLTLSHMSIYGYEKNTTPKLKALEDNKRLIAFDNALSIGTHTRLSVPYMLVGMEGIDPLGRFYQTPTIFNYAKARGYNTAFVSAQDTAWGHIKELFIDNDVDYFFDGLQMNKNASVHKGADDMQILKEVAIPYISNQTKPFMLVLQMDGSHYPYDMHSSQQHKKFLPELEENSINAYDNTVVKTDDYIAALINYAQDKNPNTWVFYSSDHGQGLGGKSGMFNQSFVKNTIHNPLLIAPPKGQYNKLLLNKHQPVSQADIVPTILDIIAIKPHANINGRSLLNQQSDDRMRVVSKYMPTQHNEKKAVLVNPDLNYYFIDFEKMSVTMPNGKKTIQFKDWDKNYQQIFIDKAPALFD